MAQNKMYLDKIAIVAALLCAIHCAAFPILLMLGINGSLGIIDHWVVDLSFIVFGIFFLYFSIVKSYFKHKNKQPIIVALIGTLFFLIALSFKNIHLHSLFAIGGILWAIAHFLNFRILKKLKQ